MDSYRSKDTKTENIGDKAYNFFKSKRPKSDKIWPNGGNGHNNENQLLEKFWFVIIVEYMP